jgi:hypothetical protein
VGVAAQHPSLRLGHHSLHQADRGAQPVAESVRGGRAMEATEPFGGLRLPEDAPRDPQQAPVELPHPGLAALADVLTRPERRRPVWCAIAKTRRATLRARSRTWTRAGPRRAVRRFIVWMSTRTPSASSGLEVA